MICDTVILCRVTLPLPGHRVQKLSFYLLNHDLDTIVNVNSFRGRLSAQLTAITKSNSLLIVFLLGYGF